MALRMPLAPFRFVWLARWLLVCAVFVVLSLAGRVAFAQSKANAPIQVLTLDSDDAEDQADALSVALRARAKSQAGWTISDNAPSLSMLTAAHKCPQRPDASCTQRISDVLKTDRFIWGIANKSGKGQVTAEVHFYTRGKAETTAKETFPDNLKDPNDENLKRVASRLVDRLAGTTPATGTVLVKATETTGVVFVDGNEKGKLDKGQLMLELSPGKHTIEVRAPGFITTKQEISVAAGSEAQVSINLAAEPPPSPPNSDVEIKADSHGSGRKIAGWTLIGLGVVAAGFGVFEAVQYFGLKGDNDDFRAAHQVQDRSGNLNVPSKELICNYANGIGGRPAWASADPDPSQAKTICDNFDKAPVASILAWVGASVGLVGITAGTVLLVTDKSSSSKESAPTTGKPNLRIIPTYGPRNTGLDLRVTF
jgi:hypothetical protein